MKKEHLEALLREQKHEITAYHIYSRLAKRIKNSDNAKVLTEISLEEKRHYDELARLTGMEVKPSQKDIWFYYLISLIFGITFGLKLLERTEDQAQDAYDPLKEEFVTIQGIMSEEDEHEQALIAMINEEKLNYIGSIVLGLNDALVELTGALAGYTFAFQNTRLIALTGLITGISAAFSMASSEYLSTKHEGGDNALASAVYTGLTYLGTVILLIMPFLLLSNPFLSLGITLLSAVIIIAIFNFYISVAKDTPFKQRFFEMSAISLGVSGISFLIGVLVKTFLGIEV